MAKKLKLLPFKEIPDENLAPGAVRTTPVPTIAEKDIVNLTGKDITVLSCDGTEYTVYKHSGYTMSLKSNIEMFQMSTNKVAMFQDLGNGMKYSYKDREVTFNMLPAAEYYLVNPEEFFGSERGQFCTYIKPMKAEGKTVHAGLLFKKMNKPGILEITDNGLLKIRAESDASQVLKSFKYNYNNLIHISSKLHRFRTVLMRLGIYIKTVACDEEVAKTLGLEPDIKADLSNAFEGADVYGFYRANNLQDEEE